MKRNTRARFIPVEWSEAKTNKRWMWKNFHVSHNCFSALHSPAHRPPFGVAPDLNCNSSKFQRGLHILSLNSLLMMTMTMENKTHYIKIQLLARSHGRSFNDAHAFTHSTLKFAAIRSFAIVLAAANCKINWNMVIHYTRAQCERMSYSGISSSQQRQAVAELSAENRLCVNVYNMCNLNRLAW